MKSYKTIVEEERGSIDRVSALDCRFKSKLESSSKKKVWMASVIIYYTCKYRNRPMPRKIQKIRNVSVPDVEILLFEL